MLQLTVLGGLTLGLEDGLVSGAMTQRRRLALLALLAVARQRGLSRDKIMAYLWPERDGEGRASSLRRVVAPGRRGRSPGLANRARPDSGARCGRQPRGSATARPATRRAAARGAGCDARSPDRATRGTTSGRPLDQPNWRRPVVRSRGRKPAR